MIVGLIGLGVMGKNLALNINDNGYKVHVYNRTTSKMEDLVKSHPSIKGFYSIKELVDSIKEPRRVIILMILSGSAVNVLLRELQKHLTSNDIVVDCGNSYFKETIERNSLSFKFVGCGISGGEVGARNGPSIMVGCDREVWEYIGDLFMKISAVEEVGRSRCCLWLGENGAGHFVKMVHNGIEYCDMGVISECYLLLVYLKYTNMDIADIFDEWNKGDLESYLLEITVKILRKENDKGAIIDQIVDRAEQKGTGLKCIKAAADLKTATSVMAESVYSRILSFNKNLRDSFEVLNYKRMSENNKKDTVTSEHQTTALSLENIRGAMLLCRAVSYIQGCNVLKDAASNYNWPYSIPEICRIWRSGCILRGKFLVKMGDLSGQNTGYLELSSMFKEMCEKNMIHLRDVMLFGTREGIPLPVMGSCLSYLDGLRTKRGSGNLIQAMRDFFGAHEVVLEGKDTHEHIVWE